MTNARKVTKIRAYPHSKLSIIGATFVLIVIIEYAQFRLFLLTNESEDLSRGVTHSTVWHLNSKLISSDGADQLRLDKGEAFDASGSTISNDIDIVVAHCSENLKWLDQLHEFDPAVCSHTRIFIYSKCGFDINLTEMIPLAAECSTLRRIDNCGTQEYAFFRYILDNYDSMSAMVSFIQGDSLTENPHIIYDMMVHMPGTTYKDLSRYVKDGWHMPKIKESEKEIMRNSFPYLENHTSWLSSWRGMFAASREQIKLHPRKEFVDINKNLCSGSCGYLNCNMEIFFSPFFGCDYRLYTGERCQSGIIHKMSRTVFAEDYMKDAYANERIGPEAKATHWSRCENRTIYYSRSTLNGLLLCMNESQSNFESNLLRSTARSLEEMMRNETWKPDLSNLTFKKQSQWKHIPQYSRTHS